MSSCPTALSHGCYTWCHNQVLKPNARAISKGINSCNWMNNTSRSVAIFKNSWGLDMATIERKKTKSEHLVGDCLEHIGKVHVYWSRLQRSCGASTPLSLQWTGPHGKIKAQSHQEHHWGKWESLKMAPDKERRCGDQQMQPVRVSDVETAKTPEDPRLRH